MFDRIYFLLFDSGCFGNFKDDVDDCVNKSDDILKDNADDCDNEFDDIFEEMNIGVKI